MVHLLKLRSIRSRGMDLGDALQNEKHKQKAGVAKHPNALEVFDHAGLLFDGPPGMAGLSFK